MNKENGLAFLKYEIINIAHKFLSYLQTSEDYV